MTYKHKKDAHGIFSACVLLIYNIIDYIIISSTVLRS